ncbi:MAG: S-methyl-5'-thioadenosine phosphorylase [Actinobacteria bacterium]|nr:S-methyl-5'-thioadenosine phosphorylase [Actinomycetota bacterium]
MLGVIGGTGLYDFLDDPEELTVETPYGAPSDVIARGEIAGKDVLFLPRHGKRHQWPPHRIPYRANMWALRSLGVTRILAPAAVGSLQASLTPGSFVLPDQVVDRTFTRDHTFVESGMVHVSFTHPYCDRLQDEVAQAGDLVGVRLHRGGTMVVIEGPRFSTRSESQAYADSGGSIINMTGMPEAILARELAMCYTPIALVTDMDAGIAGGEVVTQAEAVRIFKENTERMRDLVRTALERTVPDCDTGCRQALEGMEPDYLPLAAELPTEGSVANLTPQEGSGPAR